MYDVNDVASFFINIANDENTDDNITNLKLQKLLYFAQGIYVARTGWSLFDEKIEAWDLGPVVNEVYTLYSVEFGKTPITHSLKGSHSSITDDDVRCALFDVYNAYGKYTGEELSRMTHETGTPWDMIYKQGANNEIRPKDLAAFFKEEDKTIPCCRDKELKEETIEKINDVDYEGEFNSVEDLMRALNA